MNHPNTFVLDENWVATKYFVGSKNVIVVDPEKLTTADSWKISNICHGKVP